MPLSFTAFVAEGLLRLFGLDSEYVAFPPPERNNFWLKLLHGLWINDLQKKENLLSEFESFGKEPLQLRYPYLVCYEQVLKALWVKSVVT
jgi:hypothetical protein